MQSIGGNLSQDLDNYADFDGKRFGSLCKTHLRTWRENGIESLFSIPAKWIPIHAHVSEEEMGWICVSLQYGQPSNLCRTQARNR